jgi:ABC-type amino acid transport substrate-binding protein
MAAAPFWCPLCAPPKRSSRTRTWGDVFFIPWRCDQLLLALAAGKGDIVAANLTITPERQKLVDFTSAAMANVSEILVSGPASPKIASLDDLAGQEIFVRKSSSYYESLVALNKKFAAAKKPPVKLKEADP